MQVRPQNFRVEATPEDPAVFAIATENRGTGPMAITVTVADATEGLSVDLPDPVVLASHLNGSDHAATLEVVATPGPGASPFSPFTLTFTGRSVHPAGESVRADVQEIAFMVESPSTLSKIPGVPWAAGLIALLAGLVVANRRRIA